MVINNNIHKHQLIQHWSLLRYDSCIVHVQLIHTYDIPNHKSITTSNQTRFLYSGELDHRAFSSFLFISLFHSFLHFSACAESKAESAQLRSTERKELSLRLSWTVAASVESLDCTSRLYIFKRLGKWLPPIRLSTLAAWLLCVALVSLSFV